MDDATTTDTSSNDEYTLNFKNGALAKLKQVANKLDIPESDLDKVVEKGLKALELPDDGKLLFKKSGTTYVIDIKNL
ncbi:MAG TPA: hypothetical protein VMR34_01980 [Candidatus Saccharimonadales bacterium]|nr:hypothetical protein [Candidatus Saccharimonadales bacterium]